MAKIDRGDHYVDDCPDENLIWVVLVLENGVHRTIGFRGKPHAISKDYIDENPGAFIDGWYSRFGLEYSLFQIGQTFDFPDMVRVVARRQTPYAKMKPKSLILRGPSESNVAG